MGWQGSWAPEKCGGQTEGCSVKWTVVVKNKQKTIHGKLSGTLPLEREKTLLAVSPSRCSAGECTFLSVHGDGGKVPPLQNGSTSLPHKETTLSFYWSPLPWPLPLPLPLPSLSPMPTPLTLPLPSPLQWPIAVAIAVGHCRCSLRQPLPPLALLPCRQPLLLPLPFPCINSKKTSLIGHYLCDMRNCTKMW